MLKVIQTYGRRTDEPRIGWRGLIKAKVAHKKIVRMATFTKRNSTAEQSSGWKRAPAVALLASPASIAPNLHAVSRAARQATHALSHAKQQAAGEEVTVVEDVEQGIVEGGEHGVGIGM